MDEAGFYVQNTLRHNWSRTVLIHQIESGLSDIHKPIDVSAYTLTQSLPKDLMSSLPTVEEIENELSKE